MNVLWIDACIRKESRTRELCEYYLNELEAKETIHCSHVKLTESGLQPFDEAMLEKRMMDIEQGTLDGPAYTWARDFAAADLLVVGAPYWDCSFPSILKIYFEHLCVNHITFAYGDDGRPIPLCKAKKLIYITTAGGYIGDRNSGEVYINDLCQMFGIPKVETYRAEGLDIWGSNADAILEQTKEMISQTITTQIKTTGIA